MNTKKKNLLIFALFLIFFSFMAFLFCYYGMHSIVFINLLYNLEQKRMGNMVSCIHRENWFRLDQHIFYLFFVFFFRYQMEIVANVGHSHRAMTVTQEKENREKEKKSITYWKRAQRAVIETYSFRWNPKEKKQRDFDEHMRSSQWKQITRICLFCWGVCVCVCV